MKQVRESISAAVKAAQGWRSHETNRILRQARNLKDAGRSAEDVLAFVFSDFEKLDDQIKDIYASWDQIERFVNAKDEDGFMKWSYERECARQTRLGVKIPKPTDYFLADRNEQFKRWVAGL